MKPLRDEVVRMRLMALKVKIDLHTRKLDKAKEDLIVLQSRCQHSMVTHHRGAWGGDGHDTCNLCGKEL